MCMNSSESRHLRAAAFAVGNCQSSTHSQPLKPECLRIPEAVRVFGLGRSARDELIADGKGETTALRKRGVTQGIRLIRCDRLTLYVEHKPRKGGWRYKGS